MIFHINGNVVFKRLLSMNCHAVKMPENVLIKPFKRNAVKTMKMSLECNTYSVPERQRQRENAV